MNAVEDAIIRTILYADVFNFPLTVEEIHHFLIAPLPLHLEQIRAALNGSPRLRAVIRRIDEFFVWEGRESIVAVRRQRDQAANLLLPQALFWGRWLARLPFVRMVAITGALSMRNCSDRDDDLDYLIVSAAGRVWLTRLLCVALVRIGKLHGVTICPNYVLAENALQQDRQDLFIAHEIVQMLPIHGMTTYAAIRASNAWVDCHLANASGPFYPLPDYAPGGLWSWIKRGLEWLLNGSLGSCIERWEYRRKLRRFASELSLPNHAARLDESRVKGHFRDHGHPVLIQYADRLRMAHVTTEEVTPARMAGD